MLCTIYAGRAFMSTLDSQAVRSLGSASGNGAEHKGPHTTSSRLVRAAQAPWLVTASRIGHRRPPVQDTCG